MSRSPAKGFRSYLNLGGTLVLVVVAGVLAADLLPRLGPIVLEPTPDASRVGETLRDLSRVMGVTLSMLVALCAIALPLTANVYTPKLIELFVADRLNRVVLGYLVAANVFVLWNAFVIYDAFPATARLRVFVCLVLSLGALLLIAPYFYYVLHFLIPRSIVERLQQEVLRDLKTATRRRAAEDVVPLRERVLENIQYLGKIVLRSVDRYDRDTSDEGLRALRAVFEAYEARKPFLPPEWHRPTRGEMQELGPELAREALRQRAGVEVAVLSEFHLVLPLAVGRLPDVVATIARFCRKFGVLTTERGELGAREQVTLFFNTFLRTALQKKHSDTFYKFVYQYRRFAEEVVEKDPAHAQRVAFFLDYYGHQAVRMGMGFLINVVAYDIAGLCDLAYQRQAACREEMLDTLIHLDRDWQGLVEMPGVVKAQIILAAKLQTRGELQPAKRLISELRKVPREKLEDAFAQIVGALEENFWEIADHRRHLDHVEPRFRPAVENLRQHLLGPHRVGKDTQAFLRAVTETMLNAVPPISTESGDSRRLTQADPELTPPPPPPGGAAPAEATSPADVRSDHRDGTA